MSESAVNATEKASTSRTEPAAKEAWVTVAIARLKITQASTSLIA